MKLSNYCCVLYILYILAHSLGKCLLPHRMHMRIWSRPQWVRDALRFRYPQACGVGLILYLGWSWVTKYLHFWLRRDSTLQWLETSRKILSSCRFGGTCHTIWWVLCVISSELPSYCKQGGTAMKIHTLHPVPHQMMIRVVILLLLHLLLLHLT